MFASMVFLPRVIKSAASARAPVPQSKISRSPLAVVSSTQEVLPPKWFVAGPGVAIDPLVPQKRTLMCAPSSVRWRGWELESTVRGSPDFVPVRIPSLYARDGLMCANARTTYGRQAYLARLRRTCVRTRPANPPSPWGDWLKDDGTIRDPLAGTAPDAAAYPLTSLRSIAITAPRRLQLALARVEELERALASCQQETIS